MGLDVSKITSSVGALAGGALQKAQNTALPQAQAAVEKSAAATMDGLECLAANAAYGVKKLAQPVAPMIEAVESIKQRAAVADKAPERLKDVIGEINSELALRDVIGYETRKSALESAMAIIMNEHSVSLPLEAMDKFSDVSETIYKMCPQKELKEADILEILTKLKARL